MGRSEDEREDCASSFFHCIEIQWVRTGSDLCGLGISALNSFLVVESYISGYVSIHFMI